MHVVLFFIGILATVATGQRRPPNYSLDDMPETSFDCRDKILGGYYADQETDCQMFHVCVKVPGVGVQNFRFLCPNETAFDQENQICADWYDVDCEASILYYSDNFDLYRIGYEPGSPNLPVSRAPAVPLGPSTSRPPHRPPANRHRVRPNVREEEEDYFLQRSETGDHRLQQQSQADLRSSSSGNYFTNKNEEEEERRKPTPSPAKKKLGVRKFRKRPQQQANTDYTTPEPTTTAAPFTYANNDNNFQSGSSSPNFYNSASPSGTYSNPSSPSNYNSPSSPSTYNNPLPTGNFNNPSSQSNYNNPSSPSNYNNPSSPSIYNNNPSSPSTYNNPSSTSFTGPSSSSTYNNPSTASSFNVPSTTALPPVSRSGNAYLPRYNTIQRNGQPSSTTLSPSTVNNGDYSTYQSPSTFNNQRGGNFIQRSTAAANYNSPTTTQAPTTYNSNNNKRGSFARNPNNARFSSNYKSSPASVSPTISTTYQTTKNDYSTNNNAAYNTNARSSSYSPSTTAAPTSNFQYNNNYQRNSFASQPSTTEKAPTSYDYQSGSSEEYNNYRGDNYDYQRTAGNNGEYADNDRNNGESLKTAPSNNYRPSNFNTYQNNNYKTTVLPTKNYTASVNSVTPRSYSSPSQQTNYSPSGSSNFFNPSSPKPFTTNSVVTTFRPAQTASLGFTASTTPQPTKAPVNSGPPAKKGDAAYDYAYYDEKEPEYDSAYSVSDFGVGGEPQKVARSIKS